MKTMNEMQLRAPRNIAAAILAATVLLAANGSGAAAEREGAAAASQPKTGEAAASQPGGASRERILAVMRKVNAYEAARKSADRNWVGGTYYTGVMALYRAGEEPAVLEQAVAWAEQNQWAPGTEGPYSANSLTCGQTYLELYFLKRDETRIAKIRAFVDAQVEAAKKQKMSAQWGYIDTLYVGPPAIAMLGELSGERKYYDFLDKMFWATAESLLEKETGLFYRDRGYIGKQTERGKKILWSRGNGWAIAGTARVLQHMPKEHPTRARYVELLRTLAASLAKVQGEDGLWRSNLADAEQFPNPETSGSAFFCYAMAWGVNEGLLDKATYLPVVARAWRGLVACVQPDGRLGFAQAVGAEPDAAGPKSAFPYATGLFLLAGSEVLKLAEELSQAGAGAAPASRPAAGAAMPTGTRMNGYIGYWWGLGSAYSGGMGTYTPHHIPMAVYSAAAGKTFFVWGGTTEANDHLVIMVSYYDHKTGTVPRPVVVRDCLDKGVGFRDAHANPTMCIDAKGHVWVFCAARGSFPGQIYRSVAPLDINQFEMVWDGYIPYPQPWHFEGRGFLLMYTKYTGGREAYWRTSDDGRTWAKEQKLARDGHYQASCTWKGRLLDALDWHPGSSDNRTNLYFVQSDDIGKTWTTVEGKALATPLTFPDNPALVKDYKADGLYVFLNDITADAEGRPLIFYITSASGAYGRGPRGDPRWWTVAHWTGKAWVFSEVTKVDHNYDLGGIYAEADGTWRIIGPGGPGPEPGHTGGEMEMWTSRNQGKTWKKVADLTAASPRNHSFARGPVNAHPDFYAFWADGDALKKSESHLYFATRAGKVFRLPRRFEGDSATPEPLKTPANAPAATPANK
jgi:rhamnogalacturonyl hydrolase YesR